MVKQLLGFIWRLPRSAAVALIRGYQATLSPDHAPLRPLHPAGDCRHDPPCSLSGVRVPPDRVCVSHITRPNIAATAGMAGMEDLVISGGTEMMSLPKKGLLPMGANNAHLQDLHP